MIYILAFFFSGGLNAQLVLPNYKLYGLKDGLPQAQITSLFQDSRGYIWAGTNNGVARFNGEKFFPFTSKNGFPFSYVNGFREGSDGSIWALNRHGIANISGDSITTYPQPDYLLRSFDIGIADTLWLWGVHKNSEKEWLGYFINGEYNFVHEVPRKRKWAEISLYYDQSQKDVIFITEENVFRYNKNKLSIYDHLCFIKEDQVVQPISIKGDVILFYGSMNRDEMLYYAFIKDKFVRVGRYLDGKWAEPLPDKYNNSFPVFQVGEKHYFERNEIKAINIPEHHIKALLKDKEGTLWLGAERGVLRIFNGTFTNYNPTLLPEVWSVTEQPQGKFWFASYSFGLKTFQDNRLSTKKFNGKDIYHYFHPAVGNNGTLYFPFGNGVLKQNPDGKSKILSFSWNDNRPICFYTYYDSIHHLLFSGFRGNVIVWDDNDNIVRKIGHANGRNITGFAHCIAQDSSYNYWFGSPDIYRYNWDTDSLKRYAFSAEINNCFDIATDYFGTTWFGTQKGLYYYNKEDDKLNKVDIPELQEVVSTVFPIDDSRLLLSQPDGLYLLDIKTFNRKREIVLSFYNESNGYLGGEPGQAGAYKDSEGNIWITGSNLLSRINPDLLAENFTQKINPIFTKCNHTPILYGQHEIQLPFNQNSATVVFDAVAFNRARPIEYQYRTDKNSHWNSSGTDNYIVLNNLPHGKTNLYLRASFQGSSNKALDNERMLTINVRKAFYNQTWFIPLTIFILFLTLIILVLIYGKTRIQLQKANTQAKISEVETIQAQMNPHFVYNVLANLHKKTDIFICRSIKIKCRLFYR